MRVVVDLGRTHVFTPQWMPPARFPSVVGVPGAGVPANMVTAGVLTAVSAFGCSVARREAGHHAAASPHGRLTTGSQLPASEGCSTRVPR